MNSGKETVQGWEKDREHPPHWEGPAEASPSDDLKYGRPYLCQELGRLCPRRGDSMHTGPEVAGLWPSLKPSVAGRIRPDGRGRCQSDPAGPFQLQEVLILRSVPWEGTERFKQRFHFKNVIWATG